MLMMIVGYTLLESA